MGHTAKFFQRYLGGRAVALLAALVLGLVLPGCTGPDLLEGADTPDLEGQHVWFQIEDVWFDTVLDELGWKQRLGTPDLTGPYAWSHIEDEWFDTILAAPGWNQIVEDSAFPLGETTYLPDEPGHMPYYSREYGAYPSIDGSTVAMAMVVEFARQHLDLPEDELAEFVSLSTTHWAYINLIKGEERYIPNGAGVRGTPIVYERRPVDLVIATMPSAEELEAAQSEGIQLVIEPVCLDGFVFITHVDNPVDGLTTEQIQGIYSGGLTNWQQLGGDRHKIAAYQRELNSGSQTAMEEMVMQGIQMTRAPHTKTYWGMGDMIDAVAEYENDVYSIGYTYRYYLDVLYRNESIKVLSVDGVYPDSETIQSGEYPYTAYYYGVIRDGDQDGVGGRFLDWMLSEEGQACIAQAGYIPLP